jgi:hypothetical protein
MRLALTGFVIGLGLLDLERSRLVLTSAVPATARRNVRPLPPDGDTRFVPRRCSPALVAGSATMYPHRCFGASEPKQRQRNR